MNRSASGTSTKPPATARTHRVTSRRRPTICLYGALTAIAWRQREATVSRDHTDRVCGRRDDPSRHTHRRHLRRLDGRRRGTRRLERRPRIPLLRAWLPPFRSLRAPARFAMIVLLGLSVLTAIGLARLARTSSRRRRALAAAALIVLEYSTAPLTIQTIPRERPPVYTWVSEQPRQVTLELPVPLPTRCRSTTRSTCMRRRGTGIHWPTATAATTRRNTSIS